MAKVRPVESESELQALGEMTVDAVLTRWPRTAPVFQSHKTACLGCPITSFCTVTYVAQTYDVPVEQFLTELMHVICEVEEDAPS